MREINKYQNILSYKINLNEIIQYENGSVKINGTNFETIKNKIYIIYIDQHYYIDDREGNYFILNKELKVIESGVNKAFFSLFNYVGFQLIEDDIIYTGVIENNKYLKKKINVWGPTFCFKNSILVFLKNLEIIDFLNFKNEVTISFPLSTLGTCLDGVIEKPYQVAGFSGIYENTLVCTMNSGAILLLDIEKGEVKGFFKDAKVNSGVYQKEENSPIFLGLSHWTFIEINAETGEMLRQIDIEDELKRVTNIADESPCWFGVAIALYHEGLFYFYGHRQFLGIYDPANEKIIDFHWFKFEKKQTQLKGGIENLQVKGNEIYCLDTANTLHILNR